jgi:hypothetical protein
MVTPLKSPSKAPMSTMRLLVVEQMELSLDSAQRLDGKIDHLIVILPFVV